jgi:hypothetical protein
MTKYTYEIRKREESESLNGYGFELIIFENDKIIKREGAFGSKSMAYYDWKTFLAELISEKSINSLTIN